MNQVNQTNTSQTITVTDWIIVFIIQAIPVVGFVMLFVWAFGSNTPPSKANFAKAVLVLALICIIIFAVLLILFGGMAALSQHY